MNYLAFPTILIASVFFGIGVWQERQKVSWQLRIAQWIVGLLVAIPGILFAVYYLKVLEGDIWFYRFRAVPFIELTAGGAGLLAGMLFEWVRINQKLHRFVRPWFVVMLLILGLVAPYMKPLIAPPRWAQFHNSWADGICLQTTESSCGPACAATLLLGGGQPVTEEQIARESFTSRTGTEIWYLARTLSRHGVNTEFVFQSDHIHPWPVPSIAGVRFPSFGDTGHFIVVLAQKGNDYVIGDPLLGRIVESQAELAKSYHFTGFFLALK